MNFEQARFNMVEQQIRPWYVLDQRVLDVILATPREDFVPEAFRRLAFCDTRIPIGEGQVMMTPKVEARLLQALLVQPGDRALEIGTGSGYLTALLARMAGRVTSVDVFERFTREAADKLRRHGFDNVRLETGDAVRGWAAGAPYDAIAVTGSVPVLERHFQEQLAVGGRLFVIVGEPPIMEALLVTRVADDEWWSDSLFDTSIPSLVGAPRRERFVV